MAIPVTNIQPPQIITPQGKVDAKAAPVAAASPVEAKSANVAVETTPAAKKISAKEENNSMALPKSPIGVIEPPQDIYQYSMNKDLAEKNAVRKEALSEAFPIGATGLGGGSKNGQGGGGFFKNLLLLAAVTAGTIFAAKKIKLSKPAGDLSNLTDLKSHVDEVVDLAKSKVLKAFNVKKTNIRVTDEAGDVIKEVLNNTRKLASEAKNIEGKAPKIIVKLKENSGEASKAIKEAIAKNDINSLSDDVLKHVEYINLDYITSDKNSSKVIIDVVKGEFAANGSATGSNGWDKAVKFFKEFLAD